MEETIGQQLQQARQSQQLTLEQVASATLMRVRYLRALEEGDFAAMPSMAQARGFLRAYASYLKLDPEPLLKELNGSPTRDPATVPLSQPDVQPSRDVQINYEEADAIYRNLGKQLQYQRELLGLSLDDVVRYTHLRRHYLDALEKGKIDDLPSPVQGRGFLENYAVFLGMDPEPLLLSYAEGLQARLTVRKAVTQDPATQPAARRRRPLPLPLRRLLSPDILIGATFAVFLVIFVFWGAIRIFSMNSDQPPQTEAPSIADVLLATETPTLEPTPFPETPTPALPQAVILPEIAATDATAEIVVPGGDAPGVQVYITVLQRGWLRAIVDGKIEFEGRVIPGSAYPFVGETSVELLTSNGAGIQVFYNQQDMGAMGFFGQVVDQIFTTQGVLTPTPTITPTPTLTPRVTPTVTPPNLPGSSPALP
jgi:cytoskeleton protein RodZ